MWLGCSLHNCSIVLWSCICVVIVCGFFVTVKTTIGMVISNRAIKYVWRYLQTRPTGVQYPQSAGPPAHCQAVRRVWDRRKLFLYGSWVLQWTWSRFLSQTGNVFIFYINWMSVVGLWHWSFILTRLMNNVSETCA